MCGIVGLISKNKNATFVKNVVMSMNKYIFHRGPDNAGYLFEHNIGLAMRRLSIIDLTYGDQPIYNENKDIVIFFNGEIYNYQSIKKDLIAKNHTFYTNSDTETIIHAYEEWGIEETLNKLDGMFAFALYDKEKNKLILARDRFGEKPLYYFHNNESFVFASELMAIIRSKTIEKIIDPESLYLYLSLHYVPFEKTIIKNIYKLLPAHYLVLDTRKFSIQTIKYWSLSLQKIHIPFQDAVNEVRKLVTQTSRERMIADVPIGAFLSGGIDSSILVANMADHVAHLHTFSIGFSEDEFDESVYAKFVAKKFGTKHHHFYFTSKKAQNSINDVILSMDEPLGDQALLPVYLLSKEARKYVKVVASGEGADEIFGGYDYYHQKNKTTIQNIQLFLSLFVRPNLTFLNENSNSTASGFPLISNNIGRKSLININVNDDLLKDRFFKHYDNRLNSIKDPLSRKQFTDLTTWLPDDLLMKYDKMAMANSLEGRAPYLNTKLVEFVINLPKEYKYNNHQEKYILRKAFAHKLPSKILNRQKQGFRLPMDQWLQKDLSKKLVELAHEKDCGDLINNKVFLELVGSHTSGRKLRGRLLYSIFVYKLWYKALIQ